MPFGGNAHHAGVASHISPPGDADNAVDPMADLGACAELYEQLEYCLADNRRDWTKCQGAVAAVKKCMLAHRKQEPESTEESR